MSAPKARIFKPFLEPARDKAARGGRGGGKSHFFANDGVEKAVSFPGDSGEGFRWLCGREIQKSLKQSAKFLIESKIRAHGLTEADGFKIFNDRIQTPKDGVIDFVGLQDHTAESVKSFENYHRFWGEEAQTISQKSLNLIRPTIRWENQRLGMFSELHWSWNGRRKSDAVDKYFFGPNTPENAIIAHVNWYDNPWFPDVLNEERLECLRLTPDQYDHIWEGGYATVMSGAYYAKHLAKAKSESRIKPLAFDPLMTIRAIWDIGGTGAKADATAIWITQWVGEQIKFLDYYEATGQPLDVHINWLRKNGYENALCILPHDGKTHDKVHKVSFESYLEDAGFDVEVIPNQGPGAAMLRVEAARRLFPRMYFDKDKTEAGREAIGWYHEKWDEDRDVGLGPDHDWSSHGSDAFGLCAVCYEEPKSTESDWTYMKRVSH